MRAPYNIGFDVTYGPASIYGPPGVTYAINVAGRFVPYDRIFSDTAPGEYETAWLTSDDGPWHPPEQQIPAPATLSLKLSAADVISIPTGAIAQWYVSWFEFVLNKDGTAIIYWRTRLAPLPYPF